MKTILIHPSQNLIERIVHLLKPVKKDYSSNMVVFPGKRPAHFLRKVLSHNHKKSIIPPTLFSIDEFVHFISDRQGAGRQLDTIDAVAILYDIHRSSPDPIGKTHFMTPDSFFPVGLKIFRDIEELFIENVSVNRLKMIHTYSEETIPHQTVSRLQSLSYFYETFYRTITEMGLSTRSLRYRIASETLSPESLAAFSSIVFAGFFALTKTEQVLFKKLLCLDQTTFIFQDGRGIRDRLKQTGISIEQFESNGSLEPEIHLYRSPDTHGQTFALCKIFGQKTETGCAFDEKTAVVLPASASLFPLLRQAMPVLEGTSYNISLGYPLLRTPVFSFLSNLMELIMSMDGDLVYLPDYLRFILHPYTKNIYFNSDAEITRIMFHSIEQELSENRTKTFLSLDEIENNDAVLNRILDMFPDDGTEITCHTLKHHLQTIHKKTIGTFLAFENVGDFALKCMNILKYIYSGSTARLHPFFFPFSEAFVRALDTLSVSMLKDVVFADRSSYFLFFRKYIATFYLPFEGTPVSGLQILGFLETRNLTFETVFLLDVNEEILPETKKEDSLLPYRARVALGLPTYLDRDDLAAYYFDILTRGAKEVHLFYCENDTKERSRFIEKLLWDKQKKSGTLHVKYDPNLIQYTINLENAQPRDIPKSSGMVKFLRDFEFSPTALDTYLTCPIRFFYCYVLKVRRKESLSGEVEKAEIGRFVHKVLSDYFSRKTGYTLQENDIDIQALGQKINRLFELTYGKNIMGSAYLLRRQIQCHLKKLFTTYYLPLIRRESVVITNSEYRIRSKFGSFRIKGIIDSIEKRNNRIFIVDYKTGANPHMLKINFDKLTHTKRETWNEAIGSIQLPFYLMLYSAKTGIPMQEMIGVYLLLGKTVLDEQIELHLFQSPEEVTAYSDMLRTVIYSLLNEITDPSVPFTRTDNPAQYCPGCDYHYLCGTQWYVK